MLFPAFLWKNVPVGLHVDHVGRFDVIFSVVSQWHIGHPSPLPLFCLLFAVFLWKITTVGAHVDHFGRFDVIFSVVS